MNRRLSPVVLGGLIAGVLDISYAIVFSWFRSGTSPVRILQSVASGLLGRDAYSGGAPAAALGLVLHFVIAMSAAFVYFFASGRLQVLVRRPVLSGIVYGVFVFAFMNLVVIPLSRIGHRPPMAPVVLVTGLLVHMFFIGLPIALATRRALEGPGVAS